MVALVALATVHRGPNCLKGPGTRHSQRNQSVEDLVLGVADLSPFRKILDEVVRFLVDERELQGVVEVQTADDHSHDISAEELAEGSQVFLGVDDWSTRHMMCAEWPHLVVDDHVIVMDSHSGIVDTQAADVRSWLHSNDLEICTGVHLAVRTRQWDATR